MNSFQHQRGRFLTGALLSAILLAFSVAAKAETWPLTLKKLNPPDDPTAAADSNYLFFMLSNNGSEQSFQAQVGPAGKNRIEWPGMAEKTAEFQKIVKKEPKYQSDYPFRGVAELGSKKYAFALDVVPPVPKAEKPKPDAQAKKPDAEQSQKEATEPQDKKADPPPKKFRGYNRLYFDFNGNGDLTDDKIVSAESTPETEGFNPLAGEWASFQFPEIEVALDVEGTKFDYACSFSGYLRTGEDVRYASVSLQSPNYREGDITLDGKTTHVILLDSNCNGRFDDAASVAPSAAPNEPLNLVEGDSLLLDFPAAKKVERVAWNRTNFDEYRRWISKIVDIDGRYYNLKITPAGDKISLEEVEVPTGNITNPNDGFSAVIYSDKCVLKISGNKDAPISVPAGRWKLLSYKIDRTKIEEAEIPEKKPETPKQSIVQALGKSLLGASVGTIVPTMPRRHDTYVEAQATSAYKEVEVRQGETVVMPFGPPYKPHVEVGNFDDEKQTARLSLSLVGSAGEVCSDLEVKGGRPPKPEFTIIDPQDKLVVKGAFEYG